MSVLPYIAYNVNPEEYVVDTHGLFTVLLRHLSPTFENKFSLFAVTEAYTCVP